MQALSGNAVKSDQGRNVDASLPTCFGIHLGVRSEGVLQLAAIRDLSKCLNEPGAGDPQLVGDVALLQSHQPPGVVHQRCVAVPTRILDMNVGRRHMRGAVSAARQQRGEEYEEDAW